VRTARAFVWRGCCESCLRTMYSPSSKNSNDQYAHTQHTLYIEVVDTDLTVTCFRHCNGNHLTSLYVTIRSQHPLPTRHLHYASPPAWRLPHLIPPLPLPNLTNHCLNIHFRADNEAAIICIHSWANKGNGVTAMSV
jgi:hypothetical protein